ncbi:MULTISPECIES: S1C family serine protease [unclassified Sporosarcina]|uniref:S1C family serine protease n=1 Tax=unclassified Sporosarcina TaxID=2647733 RepID=UPI00203ED9FE|nr:MULTISPECIES: trypsin-like peptidase domain-containing protein [unclassified Sporosarcina]GKV66373.1 serine protease Do-like HtrB [Sporosarcina sp. NCCP-2331]GLB56490.1 serine protease Do-like HtrB [Sporosarcina sp. NCCP-2378]
MGNNTVKRVLSIVGSGVVGSMLTLGVVVNTDLLTSKPETKIETASAAAPSYGVESLSATSADSLADMVEQSSKAIVGVVNYQSAGNRFAGASSEQPVGTGSGVIYKIDGDHAYIVTNNHVIENAQKIEVTLSSGTKAKAELLGTDALTDIAVLQIDKKYASDAVTLGDSDKVRAGDSVIAIGNPLGLDFSGTVTKGIVSSASRTLDVNTSAGTWQTEVIQTDAAINSGNSGGALFNTQGEVIGINSLKVAQSGVEGIGFAIPSNEVKTLVEQLTEHGEIERPYLGIGLADLANIPYMYVKDLPESVKGGVMVTAVEPGSAAEKAGLQEQDVLTGINGDTIESSLDLRKYLYSKLEIGSKANVTIYRGGIKQELNITLTGSQLK